LFSVIVGVLAAWHGLGYWSLVIAAIANSVAAAIGLWIACPWTPGSPTRRTGIRRMVKFGGNLTAASVLIYVYRKIDDFLVAWRFGTNPLAVYQKAYGLLLLPMQQINAPVSAVALPALSRLQDSPEEFRRYFYRAISFLALVGMPLVVLCFCAAQDIVGLILGSQWAEVVPLFRALAFAAFVDTVSVAAGWTLLPFGHSGRQFLCSTTGALVCAIGFVVGLHWGVYGVAASLSIVILPVRLLQFLYSFRGSPIQMWAFLKCVFLPMCASLASGAALCLVAVISEFSQQLVVSLVLKTAIIAITYLGILAIVPSGRIALWQFWNLRLHILPRNAAERSSNA
jgi:O-antigen/teichoic acid export membrane protein